MQDKMASRGRVINTIYAASFYVWFPLFRWATRRLPRKFLYALARQTVGRYFALRPKYLRAIRANYEQILGAPADSAAVIAAARRMVDNHSYHWIDFFSFAERGAPSNRDLVGGFAGAETLKAAIEARQGVILATAHIGNWYIGGMLLAELGHTIHVVYKPDRFPLVEKIRASMMRRARIESIPVGRTMLSAAPIARALSSGGIVAMQCDRDFNNTGIAVEFFGRPAYFPRGPFVAAMATGAAFVPSFIIPASDRRHAVFVEEPLSIVRDGGHEAALKENVRRFAEVLERFVRKDPTEWFCFYPFWDDPSRVSGPSSP
jgi:lauroyl/myristoyl acyltransferase